MKEKIKTKAAKNKKNTKNAPLKALINEKDEIIKELNKEIESLKDKNVKLLAEFDNFQRRSKAKSCFNIIILSQTVKDAMISWTILISNILI